MKCKRVMTKKQILIDMLPVWTVLVTLIWGFWFSLTTGVWEMAVWISALFVVISLAAASHIYPRVLVNKDELMD